MSDSGKAVFLSYASQDAEAAKRICEALRAAGVEVWFDQSELVGGDQWDGKIRGQISSCALFMPIVSANTQARLEGYFRLEWKLAAQRTHTMADEKTFLLPIVIDDTKDAVAKVPGEFKAVQWTKLPGGETPPAFCMRVKQLLEGKEESVRQEQKAVTQLDLTSARSKGPRWMRPVLASVAIVIGVLAVTLTKKSIQPPAGKSAAPMTPPGSYDSRPEVAQLLARVRTTTGKFDDILHTELDSMEELLRQAAKLDPADASVWAEWAMVDCRYINHYYDRTPARRDAARRHAAQAAGLGPNRPDVRLAQADVMSTLEKNTATKAEATKILEPLLAETPGDGRVPLMLGWMAFDAQRPEASLEWFDRAARVPGYAVAGHFAKARMLLYVKRTGQVVAELDRALAAGTSAEVLLWKAFLLAIWNGDLPAARRALAEVPPQFFVEDMPATTRYYVALLSRNYDEALAALRTVPHDYLQSVGFRGPTAYFCGFALARAGKKAAAELEWRSALATVERRLVAEPNAQELMQFKALLQAALGDLEAGRKTYQAVQELYSPQGSQVEELLHLQLLPPDEAFAWVAGKVAEGDNGVLAAQLRLDPFYDPIRSDPRFPALLARAEADPRLSPTGRSPPANPGAQAPNPGPSRPPEANAKSVAVLAFANLSDDKGNEYFSDGISEELLNQLGKVAGLKVAGRTSSFSFKGQNVPEAEIAGKLGVAYVITGSVQKSGNQVRITARLVKAADGFQVWSEKFTRDLKDIFAVQDEIAGLIAQQLQLKLVESSRAARVVDPEAYRLLLEGRQFWNLRSEEGFTKAEAAFTKALALDPQFAEAHAGLGGVCVIRAIYRELDDVPLEANDLARAVSEGRRALEFDPSSADALAVLAYAQMMGDQLAESDRNFQLALTLNPNSALVHCWYALLLSVRGRLDVSLGHYQKAAEIDPLWFINLNMMGNALGFAQKYDQALGVVERATALRSEVFLPMLAERARALLALGRTEEAFACARQILHRPDQRPRWGSDARAIEVLMTGGRRQEAEAEAARLLTRYPPESYLRGFVLAALGRFDEALPFLQRTQATIVRQLYWDSTWDPWRDDPRFTQLMVKLGRAEEYKVARATLARMKAEQAGK